MRVLIDIGHPGHVHYFRNTMDHLKRNGHEVLVVARERQVIIQLLENLRIPYVNRGKGKNSKLGKLTYMISADFKILRQALKFKPDLFMSFSSPYAAQVSYLLRKPHIALNDTEHADGILSKFTYPFSDTILTSFSYLNDLGDKHIRFNSVIEGLYLHKKYYQPNPQIYQTLGLNEGDQYVIIRFVSWNAHHDYGHSGLNAETKSTLIRILEDKFKIFISSEGDLPDEFKKYQINIPADKMHDVLAYSTLFIGESATMASESVLLGTQAVYINSLPLMGYLALEQKAGLLKHFSSSEGVIPYVESLIAEPNLKQNSKEKSAILQRDFINPTDFLIWFIENFPESKKIMKDDPNFQLKFN